MTIYLEVKDPTELYKKVNEIVGDLPMAWSNIVLPNYPHYRTAARYSFKDGLRSIRVHLIKDVNQNTYNEPNSEVYEITIISN